MPLLFFDLDGVLVDSRPGILVCVNATLAKFGFSAVSGVEVAAVIGPPLESGFAHLLEQQGGHAELAAECVVHFRMLYRDAATAGTVLQPGVREMLETLSTTANLAVATSKPLRFAEPILRHLGIRNAFRIVAGPTQQTDGESKTETLSRAIALAVSDGAVFDVGTTFMLGDRSQDMLAAVATGVAPVGAAWGFGTEAELRKAGATIIVHAPNDVPPLVLRERSVQ